MTEQEIQLTRIANAMDALARHFGVPLTATQVLHSHERADYADPVVVENLRDADNPLAEAKEKKARTPRAKAEAIPAAAVIVTQSNNLFDLLAAQPAQPAQPDMTMAECNQELAQLAQSGVNTAAIMEIVQSYAPTGLRDVNPSKFREVVEKAKALKKV